MKGETICALATPASPGALSIIRVSGENAVAVVNSIFKGKNLTKAKSHTVHYGHILTYSAPKEDENLPEDSVHPNENRQIIDEVMVAIFRAPRTFTGEDSVEITCHGSPFIAGEILQQLSLAGARLAKPGEFTMRAFLNGRLDLAQAESVADLIASENQQSRDMALNQLRGGVTSDIKVLRQDLLNFTSLVELELDFAEEDVEFADRIALRLQTSKTKEKIEALLRSFSYGNAVKNGVPVAIVGKPNAGKSTLLNALLKEERAIVSDIAGTTRDTIEEVLHVGGTAFRFIDTAGIRETQDVIEEIGVRKAQEKIGSAKILLYLFDELDTAASEVVEFVKTYHRPDLKIILLQNKMDLLGAKTTPFTGEIQQALMPQWVQTYLGISARDQTNIDLIKNELTAYVQGLRTEESAVISNERHREALQRALEALERVEAVMDSRFDTEILAYELRAVLEHLGEISGEFTNDEVLGNIFSKFCIGK